MIEKQVSKGIIRTYFEKMEKCLELDVAIVGGGPSGIAACLLYTSDAADDSPPV